MLKLNITWPLFFLLLFALFAWLIRDQSSPVAQPLSKQYTPRPVRPRAAERTQPSRHKSPSMIINIPSADAGGSDSDYDAETARLDDEAGAAFFESLSRHSSEPFVMRKGAWQQ